MTTASHKSNSTLSYVPSSSTQASSRSQEAHSENLKTRKGHKKSRGGCYNCKHRKIKASQGFACLPSHHPMDVAHNFQCQENQPTCHNCSRANMSCKYLLLYIPKTIDSFPLQTQNLQSPSTIFSACDMRLLHHYIINGFPHLPLGNESVWVQDIATFAHSIRLGTPQAQMGFSTRLLIIIVWLPNASNARPFCIPSHYNFKLPASLWGYFPSCPRHKGLEQCIILPRLENLLLINQELVSEAQNSLLELRELEMNTV